MIVAATNPLDDLRALRTVKHVIHRGQLIAETPKPNARPQFDRELDKFL